LDRRRGRDFNRLLQGLGIWCIWKKFVRGKTQGWKRLRKTAEVHRHHDWNGDTVPFGKKKKRRRGVRKQKAS